MAKGLSQWVPASRPCSHTSMEAGSQSTWPQPCFLLVLGNKEPGRGIIVLVAIPFPQYFNEKRKLESRRSPGGLCLCRPVSPGADIPIPAVPMSPALPAVGAANIPEQTPPCPLAQASTCVPHTCLSPSKSLHHAQTLRWGHPARVPHTCVYLTQPTPSPGGWSIPEYLIHGRADVSNTDSGNREERRARGTGRTHEQPVVQEPKPSRNALL